MNRFAGPALLTLASTFTLANLPSASAQSLDDLNIQFHGYATQGFLYTTNNNILTTNSSSGSPAWTEAVINLSSTPILKLRLAVQARYEVLGSIGNAITVDYASADYKVNDKIGFRFGKVKTPSGLFNETQDIDPSYMWSLLPQSVYPILSRNSFLSNLGGVFYGVVPVGEKLGKIEYSAWGGVTPIASNDGYFIKQKDAGISAPNGITIPSVGAALRWLTPVRGLKVGAFITRNGTATAALNVGPLSGSLNTSAFIPYSTFVQYEHSRLMLAGEYNRFAGFGTVKIGDYTAPRSGLDQRGWYGMATYKVTDKFSAGAYHSQMIDHAASLGPARYSKDWTLSTRYDFNGFLYAKAEEHFIDGTAIVYDTQNNTGGLKPDTRLSILKVGVSF
jgi:hypothetical protein